MKKNKGFTLLELLVVVAIIGILSAVVLTVLSSSRDRSNDAKTQAQVKSMVSQAQIFSGATSTAVAPGTGAVLASSITGVAGGNMFNDSTSANNSLFKLITGLPSGTVVFYAKNGTAPVAGGLWAFAASLSSGTYCVDYTGITRTIATTMTTATSGASSAGTLYPNIIDNTDFSCI